MDNIFSVVNYACIKIITFTCMNQQLSQPERTELFGSSHLFDPNSYSKTYIIFAQELVGSNTLLILSLLLIV
jgi:hypothetical protein